MKKLIFLMAFACIQVAGFSQSNKHLQDGLYLVKQIVHDTTNSIIEKEKNFVRFNSLFQENAPEESKGLLVNPEGFVPLELSKEPDLLKQADNRTRVQLSFTRMASDKLAQFTAKNLMQQVTLIVGGEALTVHVIKAEITGGKMEISRCTDNACQKLFVQLKDNVK